MSERSVPTRIIVVDDHDVVLRGMVSHLASDSEGYVVAGTAHTFEELETLLTQLSPPADVVLLDLCLPGCQLTVAERVARLTEESIQVVVFTSDLRPVHIREAIRAGAAGVYLKSDPLEHLASILQSAIAGEFAVSSAAALALAHDAHLVAHLAPREIETLKLLAQGVPRSMVGRLMEPPVSVATVATYIKRILESYRSLGRPVYGQQDLVREAERDGYLESPKPEVA